MAADYSMMTSFRRRVIDYLRISVTDRCNFHCSYCVPPEGAPGEDPAGALGQEEIVRFAGAAAAVGITRVRITGGEPLLRAGCAGLVARLAEIPGVEDLSLTTNGSLLRYHAEGLRSAGLSRINISVDSLDPARFFRITRGARLEPVLAGLDAALKMGFDPVKVNAVMLEGIEDDLEGFVRLVREQPVHVRFIESMPIGRRRGGPWRFVPRHRVLGRLAAFGDLTPVEAPRGAGPARYFRLAGAWGTIGFISSMSDHFCSECNRLRLTADGRLRNCLFSAEEIDVRRLIAEGTEDELKKAILASMNSKRFDRRCVEPGTRTMSQIGG